MAESVSSIEGVDLACVRAGREVFRGLTFVAGAGAVLSLEGPNGAGKTSLLRIVAGLLREAAGTVRIRTNRGELVDREERGRLCGWLGHHDGVKAQLTVRENLRFWSALYGLRANDALLDRVGLSRLADAPAQYLSAGQRRRLALTRLLVSHRPVWLLDEPFSSLDAEARALVAELVHAHCAAGGIAIAATHEPLGLSETRMVLA